MNGRFIFFIVVIALSLNACSARIDGEPLAKLPNYHPLEISESIVNGTVDGAPWVAGSMIAKKNYNGDINLILSDSDHPVSCLNYFAMAPHLAFYVPPKIGVYRNDGTPDGRVINVIFPYRTSRGGGADNILAAQSIISIEFLSDKEIRGSLAAKAPTGLEHTYDLSGHFSASLCTE